MFLHYICGHHSQDCSYSSHFADDLLSFCEPRSHHEACLRSGLSESHRRSTTCLYGCKTTNKSPAAMNNIIQRYSKNLNEIIVIVPSVVVAIEETEIAISGNHMLRSIRVSLRSDSLSQTLAMTHCIQLQRKQHWNLVPSKIENCLLHWNRIPFQEIPRHSRYHAMMIHTFKEWFHNWESHGLWNRCH